jgi:hypothetical protein
MKGGRFHYTLDEKRSLAALARIAKDLTERDLVLNDVWDIAGKQAYLDKLQEEGVLPDPAKPPAKGAGAKPATQPAKVKPSVKASPTVRTTLIPQKDFGLVWPGRLSDITRFGRSSSSP